MDMEERKELKSLIQNILDLHSARYVKENYIKHMLKGYLDPDYHVFGSKTFRLTSTNPNLFSFPEHAKYASLIKSCFVAPEGKLWLVADYDQLELRVLANLSKDENLINQLNSSSDLHWLNALRLFKTHLNALLTRENGEDDENYIQRLKLVSEAKFYRQRAKKICYAMNYGMGAEGIARLLYIPLEEARELKTLWNKELYPDVTKFKMECRKRKTHLGLGCMLYSKDPYKDWKTIFNAKCQFWSILTLLALKRINARMEGKVVTCKHDAIYSWIEEDLLEEYSLIVKEEMERDFLEGQEVKLKVTLKTGRDLNLSMG